MNLHKHRQYRLAGLVLCILVGIALQYVKVIDVLDRAMLDGQFFQLRQLHRQPVQNDVVIVGIDEATFAAFREPFVLWHPHFGKLFQALAAAHPSLVGLDVVLPERSYHFLIPRYDQPLLQGLAQLKSQSSVLLGRSVDGDGNFRKIFPPYVSVAGSDSLASVMVCLDNDGIARRFEENLCVENTPVRTLAGRMAELQGLGQKKLKGLVDFSVGDTFSYVSFLDVLSWYEKGDISKLTRTFSGKPVLVGVILPYTDRLVFPVPMASWEPMQTTLPGVLFHAQVYRSLQSHGLIQEVPRSVPLALSLVAALFWFGRFCWIKVGLFCVFILGMTAISTLQLWQSHYLPVSAVLLSASVAFVMRLVYESVIQMRERQRLRGTFGNYVSPQIMQEIMEGNIKPGLGGEHKRLCVLFADIRNFTTRTEQMPADDLIKLLNGYFTEMTAAIHNHDGTIDKFIGDGLMAFFGAPKMLECPEKNALEAAQEMLVRLDAYNLRLEASGQYPIQIGIGLHVGDVIVGNVGSETRNEYTVIGDVVNTASRLEGLTKTLGYPVACSATVADAVGCAGGMVDMGEQIIKGHSSLRVYGWRPKLIQTLQAVSGEHVPSVVMTHVRVPGEVIVTEQV
ncbi:MAG: adenylate/guanylate cyclase domain-containing protein [Gallionella sp.]|nr:adenylate/guanylate cyclase domain-containing protein [Gallionella sp.]